jgi:hypothetical protein
VQKSGYVPREQANEAALPHHDDGQVDLEVPLLKDSLDRLNLVFQLQITK